MLFSQCTFVSLFVERDDEFECLEPELPDQRVNFCFYFFPFGTRGKHRKSEG